MATWFVVCLCLSGDNKMRYVNLLRYVDMYIGISVVMLAVVSLVESQVAACCSSWSFGRGSCGSWLGSGLFFGLWKRVRQRHLSTNLKAAYAGALVTFQVC